jgi:hypothetical protein
MARGWESKSVEEQQTSQQQQSKEAASTQTAAADKEEIARQKAEKTRKVQAINLARARVREQLERSTNQRYVELLNAELKHLEDELQALQ